MEYKIGLHGKPFYRNEWGEWKLSSKPIGEVREIIRLGMRGLGKECDDCGKPMRINDRHAKCQKCRGAGGYAKRNHR